MKKNILFYLKKDIFVYYLFILRNRIQKMKKIQMKKTEIRIVKCFIRKEIILF